MLLLLALRYSAHGHSYEVKMSTLHARKRVTAAAPDKAQRQVKDQAPDSLRFNRPDATPGSHVCTDTCTHEGAVTVGTDGSHKGD
jgi:hypothetical protein